MLRDALSLKQLVLYLSVGSKTQQHFQGEAFYQNGRVSIAHLCLLFLQNSGSDKESQKDQRDPEEMTSVKVQGPGTAAEPPVCDSSQEQALGIDAQLPTGVRNAARADPEGHQQTEQRPSGEGLQESVVRAPCGRE